MSKRPWDRKGVGRFKSEPVSSSSSSVEVSSVTVDGIAYHSDRFYLNRAMEDAAPIPQACTCGSRDAPPLLDRKRLVSSLNLKAAIVATYTVNPECMLQDFSTLFGPNSVPTLVLHGHKGLGNLKNKKEPSTLSQESASPCKYSEDGYEHDDKRPRRLDLKINDDEVICIDDSSDEESTHRAAAPQVPIKEEEPLEVAWLRKQDETRDYDTSHFGSSVYLTEVLTTWLPQQARTEIEMKQRQESITSNRRKRDDVIELDSDEKGETVQYYTVDPMVVQRRVRKQGVHHPKFMILFETSGSVVVLVSTANLSRQHAVDASWVQRFEPRRNDKEHDVTDATRCDGSDFGYVLANYLECQSLASKEGDVTPEAFLRKHLNMSSLNDFRRSFKFEDSQVHLIATVPGDHKGPKHATHLENVDDTMTFLYGSQRVNDILHRLSTSSLDTASPMSRRWLPPSFLSSRDRLIVQPTSFGGNWKRTNLTELLRLYLDYGAASAPGRAADDYLEQTDILWPSRDYMKAANGQKERVRVPSPDSVASIDQQQDDGGTSSGEQNARFVFMSSVSFNTIDLACISRMSLFEPSYPKQTVTNRSPHIKSFSRLFEGNEYQLRKDFGVEKAEECFSWFMLTSACLSRGAQGEATRLRGFESDEMTYTNFELGVLFVSRLQSDKKSDRFYCWKPNKCHCGQHKHRKRDQKRVKMIHLPIPYGLRPQSYQPDEEDPDMCATPYFHEIPRGTGFVGQMKLTPLGAKLAAAQK